MSSIPNERVRTSDCKQLVPLREETCADSKRCSESSSTGRLFFHSYKTPDSSSGKIHGPIQNNGNFLAPAGMPYGIGLHLNSLSVATPLPCRVSTQAPAKGSVNMQGMIPLSINKTLSKGQKSCLLSVSSGQNKSVESSMNLAPVMVESVTETVGMNQQDLHSFGTPKIGVTKSTTCLRSLKVGINLFEPSSSFRSVERNCNPRGTRRSLVHDMSQQSTCGDGEDIVQSSSRRGRKKSCTIGDNGDCKHCNCKKSKCLKLYCECFAVGLYCIAPCTCQDCFNNPDHENMVHSTRQLIESRNPHAFASKIIQDADLSRTSEEEQSERTASKRHKRGCNCKKSTCLKKYCECYQARVGCFEGCRCEGCKNIYGKKQVFRS